MFYVTFVTDLNVVVSDLQEEIEKFNLSNNDSHHFDTGIDLASIFKEEMEDCQKLLRLKEDGIQ